MTERRTHHIEQRPGAVNRYLGVTGQAHRSRPTAPGRQRPAERHTVVAGVNDSAAAAVVAAHAAAEARLRGWDLLIVHAVTRARTRERGAALLEQLARQTGAAATRLLTGSPSGCLLTSAEPGDLLVVGHARGRAAGTLGAATSTDVAARHRGPVLVIRTQGLPADPEWGDRPVVAGYDGSPWSERAVRFAAEEARLRGGELTVLWSVAPGVSEAEYAFRAARLDTELAGMGVVAHRRRVEGNPRTRFVEESARAGAMVVGSRGMGGMAGLLLGSVSQALIHGARCPVFIVH